MIDFSTPLEGMSNAEARLDRTASQLAQAASAPESSSPVPQEDTVQLSSKMVALIKEREDFEANLKTIETQNQLLMDTLQRMG